VAGSFLPGVSEVLCVIFNINCMLIFLYGADTYRLNQKLAEIIAEYKTRARGMDFAVFDAIETRAEDFFAGLRQNSLFGGKKFFVVKNPVSNKNFKEALIDGIGSIADSGHNVVFFQEGKVLKADRLLKVLAKHGQAQEFLPLEGAKLNAWILREFGGLGKVLEPGAVQALAGRAGNDLWGLANEIQKLAHFIADRKITTSDIERNTAAETGVDIFKTVDAIAGRDKKQGIGLVKDHYAKGDHPLYLLTMVARQFRNLLLVKASGGIGGAARMGIHPYVYGKTMAQARRFALADLMSDYKKIIAADFDIKTGRIDAYAGLDLLIAGI
jgi:DNA polymerase III subunit delta